MVSKQTLKYNLVNIYNTNDKYDSITLYRNLLIYNDKIRLYTNENIYENYISELYNLELNELIGNDEIN